MKYIDNDMDDLFSKAGRDYPLNTDKKNWEAVQQALPDAQGNTPAHDAKTNYLKFLPLLLLLLIPVLFLIPDHRNRQGSGAEILTKGANSGKQDLNRNAAANTDIHVDQPAADAGNMKTKAKGAVNDASPNVAEKGRASDEAESNDSEDIGTTAPFFSQTRKVGRHRSSEPVLSNEITANHTRNYELTAEEMQDQKYLSRKLSLTSPGFFPEYSDVGAVVASPGTLNIANGNAGKPNTGKNKKNRNSIFYYGLVAGPDLSTIRYQKVKHAGYAAGLMAGYQFNANWSVEMKALWSSKKYYTDGKYFDKSGARIPSYVNIHYLDGKCNMLEVPVAVRYRFTPHENSFFATVGVNSYFMNKEDYEYMADAYGTPYEGYKTYKKSGNHFFSNLQVSGGYQLKILKHTNLRIEPYLQLPLNKIGIGRMPITSAGVHFGLLRDHHF